MTKVLFLLFAFAATTAHAFIVGEDTRVFTQAYHGELSSIAKSVALIYYKNSGKQPLRDYLLNFPVHQTQPLCESIPDQEVQTFEGGSAFLIAPDLILTAGHNMISLYRGGSYLSHRQNYLFKDSEKPFFYFSDGDDFNHEFDSSRVYQGVELIEGVYASTDFAIIRLDRKVTDREPLKLEPDSKNMNVNDEVAVIGHPMGLPLTITIDGKLTQVNNYDVRSDITVFHGNSGGPLIRLSDHKVVGIVSRVHYEELPADPMMYGPLLDLTRTNCLALKRTSKDAGKL